MYKIIIIDDYHHKNEQFLNYYCKKYFILTSNIEEADIVLSAKTYIQIENYPNKKFIFGPHFSVFPNNIVNKLNNTYKNAIYIQPSLWAKEVWDNEFKFNTLPLYSIPFGVNTEKFKPNTNIEKKNVFVYFKNRNPNDLENIKLFLNSKNINYKIFSYQERYSEEDYLSYIQSCVFGLWVGCHESQGFALQEALSCNIPLLVWNVKYMKDEYTSGSLYSDVKTTASSIPYWDKTCGEYFYNINDLDSVFNLFISKLNFYNPREFILNNLSYEKCSEKWNNLIFKEINLV